MTERQRRSDDFWLKVLDKVERLVTRVLIYAAAVTGTTLTAAVIELLVG